MEAKFLKSYLQIPCKCNFSVHIDCYFEWVAKTDMRCPFCRITNTDIIEDRYRRRTTYIFLACGCIYLLIFLYFYYYYFVVFHIF